MNDIIETTATEFVNKDTQRPAFVLRYDGGVGADAVGVQNENGLWNIGINAVTFDGIGILGVGTVRMPDGKSQWWGSFFPITRGFVGTIDDAIRHAESMWDTVDAD